MRCEYNIQVMQEHESIDLYEAIDGYYAAQEDREPQIKRAWVLEHLQALAKTQRSHDELLMVWDDINALSIFIEDMPNSDLSTIPHWQYSAFVAWADEYLDEPGYSVRLEHVRRLMGNIREFYQFLMDKAHIANLREISSAFDYICGRPEVRLVETLPYTGAEHWLTVRASFHEGHVERNAVFSVSDQWLLLLLASVGGDWSHLGQIASTVQTRGGGTRKLAIYNLKRKLKRIGYLNYPADILMCTSSLEDADELDKATRWFFSG